MCMGLLRRSCTGLVLLSVCAAATTALGQRVNSQLGLEVAVPVHL